MAKNKFLTNLSYLIFLLNTFVLVQALDHSETDFESILEFSKELKSLPIQEYSNRLEEYITDQSKLETSSLQWQKIHLLLLQWRELDRLECLKAVLGFDDKRSSIVLE
tara:strand:+ start:861 stop:1184 length:324 start_codon:yes stop_codon:yes gene_type:complete